MQYEGEESERNVFYTGAAPNQQAIPAVDYLMKDERREALGAGRHRLRLSAHDQQDPRGLPEVEGRRGRGHHDQLHAVRPLRLADASSPTIKKFGSAGKKTAVVSTINGDANVPFYKELGNQGIKATDIPVVAFSVGEEELAGIDTKPLVGHLAAWNYFQSIDTPENKAFIDKWKAFTKNPKRATNDPMEAHVIGFNMWVKAVEKAGTTDPDKVIDAIIGVSVPNLTGGYSTMMPNHHITKPVLHRRDPGATASSTSSGRRRASSSATSGRTISRLEGPDLRLARADVLRELQRQDRQVRRPGEYLMPSRARIAGHRAAGVSCAAFGRTRRDGRGAAARCASLRSPDRPILLALGAAFGCLRPVRAPSRSTRRSASFAAEQLRRDRRRGIRRARRERRRRAREPCIEALPTAGSFYGRDRQACLIKDATASCVDAATGAAARRRRRRAEAGAPQQSRARARSTPRSAR